MCVCVCVRAHVCVGMCVEVERKGLGIVKDYGENVCVGKE